MQSTSPPEAPVYPVSSEESRTEERDPLLTPEMEASLEHLQGDLQEAEDWRRSHSFGAFAEKSAKTEIPHDKKQRIAEISREPKSSRVVKALTVAGVTVRAAGVDVLRGTVTSVSNPGAIGLTLTLSRWNWILASCATAVNIVLLWRKYKQQQITKKQLIKYGVISVLEQATGASAAAGGAALGALIGTFICPGIGTAVCSALGATIGSVLMSWGARKLLVWMGQNGSWSDDAQFKILTEGKMYQEALSFFNLEDSCSQEDVEGAKKDHYITYHPDQNHNIGAQEKFQKAYQAYEIIKMYRTERKRWKQGATSARTRSVSCASTRSCTSTRSRTSTRSQSVSSEPQQEID